MKATLSFFFFVIAISLYAPTAFSEICSEANEKEAAEIASSLKSWDAVYQWFFKYHRCDAHLDITVFDSVGELLAKDWNDFPRLMELSQKDDAFRRFVLSHIGLDADDDDPQSKAAVNLKIAFKNAKQRCPSEAYNLCEQIIQSVHSSITDPD